MKLLKKYWKTLSLLLLVGIVIGNTIGGCLEMESSLEPDTISGGSFTIF